MLHEDHLLLTVKVVLVPVKVLAMEMEKELEADEIANVYDDLDDREEENKENKTHQDMLVRSLFINYATCTFAIIIGIDQHACPCPDCSSPG